MRDTMRDTMPLTDVKNTQEVKVYQPGSQHVVGDGEQHGPAAPVVVDPVAAQISVDDTATAIRARCSSTALCHTFCRASRSTGRTTAVQPSLV